MTEPRPCPLCGQPWWACGETMCPQPKEPTLAEILDEAKHHTMTPDEVKAQAESWARGMMPTGDPAFDDENKDHLAQPRRRSRPAIWPRIPAP